MKQPLEQKSDEAINSSKLEKGQELPQLDAVTGLSLQAPGSLLGLQRHVGNQALVGLLERPSPLPVQREGGEGLSLKEKRKLFESGGSSLETKPKDQTVTGLTDRIISFKDALKIFQDLQRNPKAVEKEPEAQTDAPPDSPQSTTGPVTETAPGSTDTTGQTPSTDEPSGLYDKYEEVRKPPESSSTDTTSTTTAPEVPTAEYESFGGGDFEGKDLKEDYKAKEKENLDKKQKGLAFASWTPKDWKSRYVKYLTDDERTGYELKLLKDKGSTLFFLGDKVLDTTKMTRTTTLVGDDGKPKSGAGKMIFVMDTDGRIYVADEGTETATGENVTQGERWRFNHSSFIQGNPVAAAGEMWFSGGVLKGISDESGHYWPGLAEMLQLLRNLADHGVNLRGVVLSVRGEQVDAEAALQTHQIAEAKSGITDFDENVTEFNRGNAKGKVGYAYAEDAISSLRKAHKNNPGIDLTTKALELLEVLKPIVQDVQKSVNKPKPSANAIFEDARTVWAATEVIDNVDASIISVEGYRAADKLDTVLGQMNEQEVQLDDTDPHAEANLDFSKPRSLAAKVVTALGAAAPREVDDSVGEKLGEMEEQNDEVKSSIAEATYALGRLQDGKGRTTIVELEGDHADVFRRLIEIAAARINISINDVLQMVKDDILDDKSEPDKDDIDVMNSLVPGSADEFIKSVNWAELGK